MRIAKEEDVGARMSSSEISRRLALEAEEKKGARDSIFPHRRFVDLEATQQVVAIMDVNRL